MSTSDYAYNQPFYTCPVCKDRVPSEVYNKHKNSKCLLVLSNTTRPETDAMRTGEVAKVLGISVAAVLYKVQRGTIKALPRAAGRGHPVWITQSALKHYINQQAKKTDMAVKWAATGVLDG